MKNAESLGAVTHTHTHTVKFNKEVKNIDLRKIVILCAFVVQNKSI